MVEQYLLGVDLGSGALKLTLLSTNGEVKLTVAKEYPTYYPEISWAEQDPKDWYCIFKETFAFLIQKSRINPGDILALSIDAPTHTAVVMDGNFNVLRNAILWTDLRSGKQAEFLQREYGEEIFSLTYHKPEPMWTLPQLLWVKENEPEVWRKTERILFAKDYLRYLLTGKYVTDWIDALGSMFFDAEKKEWSPRLCNLMGFSVEKLPEVLSPTEVVGNVTLQASKETGLSTNTSVIAGATDTALEVLAAGAVKAGQATIKLATAGRICVVSKRAHPHPLLVNYFHVIPGKWYPGTGTRSCAACYRWYRDNFACLLGEQMAKKEAGGCSYALLDKAAAEIPIGSEGLIFHPYLQGEFTPYADPNLRASFTGIRMRHGKAHFARAILEGVALSLKDCYSFLQELGIRMDEARIIGGGARSPLWRQIVADVLGIKLIKAATDDSSFGSAIMAGVSVGVFSNYEDALKKCLHVQDVVEPNLLNHKKYAELFLIYKEIHDQLESTYRKMARISD